MLKGSFMLIDILKSLLYDKTNYLTYICLKNIFYKEKVYEKDFACQYHNDECNDSMYICHFNNNDKSYCLWSNSNAYVRNISTFSIL